MCWKAVWKAVWKASTVILATCSSDRNVGASHPFRSLIESCRAWLLPEGRSAQRYNAPWLEWMSQSLSVLCWLEEYTFDTRGTRRQKQLALRRSKYLPERVRTGIRDGPDALPATAEWLTRQLLGPLFQAPTDEGIVYVLCGHDCCLCSLCSFHGLATNPSLSGPPLSAWPAVAHQDLQKHTRSLNLRENEEGNARIIAVCASVSMTFVPMAALPKEAGWQSSWNS